MNKYKYYCCYSHTTLIIVSKDTNRLEECACNRTDSNEDLITCIWKMKHIDCAISIEICTEFT